VIVVLKHFTISLLYTLVSLQLLAEDVEKQVRLEVVPQWYSGERVKVYGQMSVRKEFDQNDWIRYVLKPSLAYSLGDAWSLRTGLGMLYTDNKFPDENNIEDRLEIRPFQGITYNYKISDAFKLDTYGRVEERFDFSTQTWNSINTLRLRLRLRVIYKFNAYQKGNYYRTLLSVEGFSSLSEKKHQTDEKYRISLGVERSFSHSQKARVEVTWESKELNYLSSHQVNYDQIYLRLRYYPTWGTLYNKLRKQETGENK
jgi:hypothetical protein